MMMTTTSSSSTCRVRIAPSPTGNLHVGTARTALFNYLFAKNKGGQFILRIEDTDIERSEEQYVTNIFDGLKALGLAWDEGPDVGGDYGPYKQSERTALYKQYAEQLVASGHAYYSYATSEELDAARAKATEEKRPFVYREEPATPEQLAAWQADASRTPSIRLRAPRQERTLTFHDAIRGEVSFESRTVGDFVILKANGTPAYNFAVVVDDGLMQISHVIRGEDHISNTPKQLLLYEALGWQAPEFAHLSMILAPDRSKLSKRHGATAVSSFIEELGYLPEAFLNFMALLGWSSPGEQELYTVSELCELFSLDRVAHSNAVFDRDKLNWMNAHYLRALPAAELLQRALPFLRPFLVQILGEAALNTYSETQLQTILNLVKEPVHTLSELPEAMSYFFGETAPEPSEELKTTVLATPEGGQVLGYVLEQLKEPSVAEAFTAETPEAVQALLKQWSKALAPLKTKTVMWVLRVAITGRVQGADLPGTLHVLGLQRTVLRLQQAQQRVALTPESV